VSQNPPARLPWIDHLRTAMIVLVVNMHACVTYSHVGDWYLMSEQEPTLAAKVPFIVWQSMLQSFFMGLLFFLAAYFAAGSLARRGRAGFVRERLVRLGLPTLLYMLVIHPFIRPCSPRERGMARSRPSSVECTGRPSGWRCGSS
jgi:glucan biosynthesis protein C